MPPFSPVFFLLISCGFEDVDKELLGWIRRAYDGLGAP
jgi:hypothetical protein